VHRNKTYDGKKENGFRSQGEKGIKQEPRRKAGMVHSSFSITKKKILSQAYQKKKSFLEKRRGEKSISQAHSKYETAWARVGEWGWIGDWSR